MTLTFFSLAICKSPPVRRRLRIHVPWTALTSMPVEVTLTGVELVLSNRKGEANYAVRPRAVGAVDHAQQNANLEISAQEVGSYRLWHISLFEPRYTVSHIF